MGTDTIGNSQVHGNLRQRSGELNFFILRESARHKEKEILADIGKHFEIIECFDILWSSRRAINNFCRLYDLDWLEGRELAQKCGNGRFLLITVWDNRPVYELAETPHGFEWTNTNILELAKCYRSESSGKDTHAVHWSMRPEETNRLLTLILGKNIADYFVSVKTPWDGSIVKMEQDILGADGWNSLEEVFYVLNNTVNYVVLRDFENLPHHFDPSVSNDIDILTDDRKQLIRILNPQRIRHARLHGQLTVKVGDSQILWDVRHTGDDYYCLHWEQDMLRDKVISPGNVYVLNNEHYFYSLVYHALIHNKTIPQDCYVKAERILVSLQSAGIIGINEEPFPGVFDYYFDLLSDYMRQKRYAFCQPQRTEYYNRIITHVSQIADRLEKTFRLSRVKPILLTRHGLPHMIAHIKKCGDRLKNCSTYYQALLNDRKVFIKHGAPTPYGGFAEFCKREFYLSERLNKMNPTNFMKILFYSENERYRCVVSEFLEGEMLDSKIRNAALSPPEKKHIIIQLKQIAENLLEANVVHRDSRASNLFITKDGTLKLIDFGRAIESKQRGACSTVRRNSLFFRRVCKKCNRRYACCDVFSLSSTLRRVGCHESYQATYHEVETFLDENPKIIAVTCKYRRILPAVLSRLKKILLALCSYFLEQISIDSFQSGGARTAS